jgi:hypothetical protein
MQTFVIVKKAIHHIAVPVKDFFRRPSKIVSSKDDDRIFH